MGTGTGVFWQRGQQCKVEWAQRHGWHVGDMACMEASVLSQAAWRVRGDKATRGQGQILQGVAGHSKGLASLGTKC